MLCGCCEYFIATLWPLRRQRFTSKSWVCRRKESRFPGFRLIRSSPLRLTELPRGSSTDSTRRDPPCYSRQGRLVLVRPSSSSNASKTFGRRRQRSWSAAEDLKPETEFFS